MVSARYKTPRIVTELFDIAADSVPRMKHQGVYNQTLELQNRDMATFRNTTSQLHA